MRTVIGNNETGILIRTIDGTAFRMGVDSISEYLLHPVFLRFFAVTILVFAVLDTRPDAMGLTGWGLVLGWACVSAVSLLWLGLWSPLVGHAARAGWIAQVYTPIALAPLALLAELTLQAVALVLAGTPWKPISVTLQQAIRDLIVIGLFDLLHGHYVVAVHPLARPETDAPPQARGDAKGAALLPDIAPPVTPVPAEPTRNEAPAPAPAADDGTMVQIGPALLPLSSILLIRTEDHYLGVTTRSGKALHRAKMADIPELHSGRAGMQINRSVWVAYAAISEITESDTRQVVVSLVTGDEERVSRPRVFAFRQAYAKHQSTRAQD